MSIDTAIARIQDIVDAMTSVTFRSFPDYPVENAEPFPFSIAYLGSGQVQFGSADTLYHFPAIVVEFHFSRVNLKQAYQQINAVATEFGKRLAGDPTLNNTVSTIVSDSSQRISYTVRPFEYGQIRSQMLLFTVPYKTIETPQSTA